MGKLTTQPSHHTGEGIFFASKMVDRFDLTANGIEWIVASSPADQAALQAEPSPGTKIEVWISPHTDLSMAEVFGRYTHDFKFDTTRCVIRLFEIGTNFVSRSEAKRLLANLDRFREVILDFTGVRGVGQGFVDEVFRVWARTHPDVRLIPEHMNEVVEFMVRRGLARAAEEPRRAPPGGGGE